MMLPHSAQLATLPASDALIAAGGGTERLRQPSSPWPAWLQSSPLASITDVTAALHLFGVHLPPVKMADGVVIPVVKLDRGAWLQRHRDMTGPVLDRRRWREWADGSYESAPPSPLRVLGFITIGPLHTVRGTLARLRTTASVAALTSAAVKLDPVELARCDYYGTSVVTAVGRRVNVIVRGAPWEPLTPTVHFQRRLREEQLFDVALRNGYAP